MGNGADRIGLCFRILQQSTLKRCMAKMRKLKKLEVENHLIITQDTLIKQIAEKEDINVVTVRNIFKSTEDIIFDYLSSTTPSENIILKVLNGISIERKYIDKKKYSRGMFQNHDCPEHVKVKSTLSKYYSKKLNTILFSK